MSSRSGPLRAQSSVPTVSITRLTALNQAVVPGDFNGDGIIDLASTSAIVPGLSDGSPQISLGNGDGTFKAPVKANTYGRVLTVGDFNRDGKLDVVSWTTANDFSIEAGNGDGMLGAAHLVAELAGVTNALAADLDGDSNLDLVAITDGTVYVYPGRGDFTFGAPTQLTSGVRTLDGAIADLNGDGRKDIVVANHDSNSISIFLNQGGLTFTAADMPLDLKANDVVARDLNGDGKVDLVVAVSNSHYTAGPEYSTQGFAYVLLGNGDGTFAQPVKYPTAPGAWQIVLGDFTRDGVLDIATANQSAIYYDDCAESLKTWDSVSILPGNGNGTFGAASSFSLADQKTITDQRYKNTVVSLNTADVNRDGSTDLIASWGAILINKPPDPNWPPSVTASSTQPALPGDHEVTLTAPASDSDQDMLLYSWTDSAGSPIPPVPQYCFAPNTLGVHTFTVTVDDQHGHSASSSVTVDFGSNGTPPTVNITAPATGEVVPASTPYTIRWTATAGDGPIDHFNVEFSSDDGAHYGLVPGCSNLPGSSTSCVWNDPDPPTDTARIFVSAIAASGPSGSATTGPFTIQSSTSALPAPWSQADIGAVGARGSATYSNGVFTVNGDGADIWGTADAFHYVYQPLAGGAIDLTTHVDSVQNVNAWTKAGLMIRGTLDAGSLQASVFVTPGKGVAFQWRSANGGTSSSTAVAGVTAPVWLRLTYDGTTVRAFYKKNATDLWGSFGSLSFAGPFGYGGLAVTSHLNGTLATAAFSSVTVAPPPPPFTTALIGGASGSSSANTFRTYTVQSKGADIWGTSDQLTYVYQSWSGDGHAVVDVNAVTNTNAWTKAGVMFRTSTAANAPHVSLFVTPGKGIAMQYRAMAGGVSAQVAQIAGVAPVFLQLTRTGNTFTGAWSTDWSTWHAVGTITVAIDTSALAGLAVTSHDTSATATATFVDPMVNR